MDETVECASHGGNRGPAAQAFRNGRLFPGMPENGLAEAGDLLEDLRTYHRYCDLHHAAFLVLLARAAAALETSDRKEAEYVIDTFTVYWLVHSLMEEESMARALGDGDLTPDIAQRHTRAHVMLTRWWHANVLAPFKDGVEDDFPRLYIERFSGMVLDHIREIDRYTFGEESGLSRQDVRKLVRHVENSGLPLSPAMPGCEHLLAILAPYMSHRLSPHNLMPSGNAPLAELRLADYNDRLWTGGKGAFRDVFVARYLEISEQIARTGHAAL